jgi:5'-nucleotidase
MARILITNDDGVDAPGLHALARAAHGEGHEVVVIAPMAEASGSGAAIGHLLHGAEIRYATREIEGLEDVPTYAVEGPPARCVFMGFLEAFAPKPDLVLSGINPGLNTGRGLLHSGTVGAVLAGADFGISGMAISVESGPSLDAIRWDTACEVARRTLPFLLDAPRKTALNVNIPGRSFDEIQGVRVGRISAFGPHSTGIEHVEPGLFRVVISPREIVLKPDTDTALVASGYVSVTSLVSPRATDATNAADAFAKLLGWD